MGYDEILSYLPLCVRKTVYFFYLWIYFVTHKSTGLTGQIELGLQPVVQINECYSTQCILIDA